MSRWGKSYGKWVQLMIPNEVLLLQRTCLGHLAKWYGIPGGRVCRDSCYCSVS